jgi:uncharacterized protein YbaR (Trm112 family)
MLDAALLDLLQCPACGGILDWRPTSEQDERIVEATARCSGCGAGYAVEHGVALLLPPGSPELDGWQEAQNWLDALLDERPEVGRALLDPDPSELAPADLLFRAFLLEERGDFGAAREAAVLADAGLYTEETRACRDRRLDALVAAIGGDGGPVVDLASGRGALVERLAARLDRTIVATDISPRVLLRTGRALEEVGLGGRVSLLACDARRTPFRDGGVATLTTNVGLGNVRDPGPLLAELRRIVSGRFLGVTTFYPPDDGENAAAIRDLGLERLLYRDALLAELAAAGWTVEVVSSCRAPAEPTPMGVVVEGAGIDALPVAATELEWALLVATPRQT